MDNSVFKAVDRIKAASPFSRTSLSDVMAAIGLRRIRRGVAAKDMFYLVTDAGMFLQMKDGRLAPLGKDLPAWNLLSDDIQLQDQRLIKAIAKLV